MAPQDTKYAQILLLGNFLFRSCAELCTTVQCIERSDDSGVPFFQDSIQYKCELRLVLALRIYSGHTAVQCLSPVTLLVKNSTVVPPCAQTVMLGELACDGQRRAVGELIEQITNHWFEMLIRVQTTAISVVDVGLFAKCVG